MKIDRMIGILSLLLQKDKITMPELAAHFEVSRRTISRDIGALCRAGIPISTGQGSGGGVHIMDGYRLDRTILSSKDMRMILAGLRSLDSVSKGNYFGRLMEKLKAGSSVFAVGSDNILIDLSSRDKGAVCSKTDLILTGIETGHAISFDYYSPKTEGPRLIDPCYLIFKWSGWYVWGFCRDRQDFRLFKLGRMANLRLSQFTVPERTVPMPEFDSARIFPATIRVKARFDPGMKWHLTENFGAESFTALADGSLLFEADMDEDGLIAWLLSCGTKVTVLEPRHIREKLAEISSAIAAKYRE